MWQQAQIDILERSKKRLTGAIRARSSHLKSADPKDPLAIAEQRAYLAAQDAVLQAVNNMIAECRAEHDVGTSGKERGSTPDMFPTV